MAAPPTRRRINSPPWPGRLGRQSAPRPQLQVTVWYTRPAMPKLRSNTPAGGRTVSTRRARRLLGAALAVVAVAAVAAVLTNEWSAPIARPGNRSAPSGASERGGNTVSRMSPPSMHLRRHGRAGVAPRPRPRASVRADGAVRRPGAPLFSFAVIADTHEYRTCRIRQGVHVARALKVIVPRRPAFVVGLGDLIAGGGDCRKRSQRSPRHTTDQQLQEVRRQILERLPMPFVPVAGNHDLLPEFSSKPGFARRAWRAFWRANVMHTVPAQVAADPGESYRFTHRGMGIAVIGFYGTEGLHTAELDWIRANVQPGDLVFRHINPFGVSCIHERLCGIAITDEGPERTDRLVPLLKNRGVRALFSGHTHAFYEGDCDGLRFINVGSLGDRSMEYVRGWGRSPYRKRQAFTWVDVYPGGRLRVTFHVWRDAPRGAASKGFGTGGKATKQGCFEAFDPNHFPAKVHVHHVRQRGLIMGVRARCVTRRGGAPKGKPMAGGQRREAKIKR